MKGLAVPVGVTPSGSTKMDDGEANDQNVLYTSLSDCDNDNAFQQDLGLGQDVVFGVPNEQLKAMVRRRLTLVFSYWENEERFRLMPETINWIEAEGSLTLEFRYLNLETDEVQSFSKNLK